MNANKTIKSILVCLFWFCTTWCCMAQTIVTLDSKVKPTKEETIIMKELKKTMSPQKIVVRQENDGFRYFLLSTKNGLMGICNIVGKSIMPLQMKTIYYFPKTSRGYFGLTCNDLLYEISMS